MYKGISSYIKPNQGIDKKIHIIDDTNSYKGERHNIFVWKNKVDGYTFYTFMDIDEHSEFHARIVSLIAVKQTRKFQTKVERPTDVPSDYEHDMTWGIQVNKKNLYLEKYKHFIFYNVKGVDKKYSSLINYAFLNMENPHSETMMKDMNISAIDNDTGEIMSTKEMKDLNI